MKIIGHRGARGLAPENTIAALQKGLEHHVDMLEFDLRVTRDGVVVLHHDRYLRDPDGRRHRVAKTSYQVLKQHDKDLATFEEVLEQIGRQVPFYIEVKPGVNVEPIIKIIKARLSKDWSNDDFILGSKNQKTLRLLHKSLPDIPKIVIEPWSGVRATYRARQLNTLLIAMNQYFLWWGFIRAIARHYSLYAYTLNDPRKAKRWERYGLAGVVTDDPDRFENLLYYTNESNTRSHQRRSRQH